MSKSLEKGLAWEDVKHIYTDRSAFWRSCQYLQKNGLISQRGAGYGLTMTGSLLGLIISEVNGDNTEAVNN